MTSEERLVQAIGPFAHFARVWLDHYDNQRQLDQPVYAIEFGGGSAVLTIADFIAISAFDGNRLKAAVREEPNG